MFNAEHRVFKLMRGHHAAFCQRCSGINWTLSEDYPFKNIASCFLLSPLPIFFTYFLADFVVFLLVSVVLPRYVMFNVSEKYSEGRDACITDEIKLEWEIEPIIVITFKKPVHHNLPKGN